MALIEKENLVKSFLGEINRCVLLEDDEKTYWIERASDLPENLLAEMYAFFKEKNDIIDSYVSKAIEADPEVVTEMKNNVQELKRHILSGKEVQEQKEENAEEKLEEAIKNI